MWADDAIILLVFAGCAFPPSDILSLIVVLILLPRVLVKRSLMPFMDLLLLISLEVIEFVILRACVRVSVSVSVCVFMGVCVCLWVFACSDFFSG